MRGWLWAARVPWSDTHQRQLRAWQDTNQARKTRDSGLCVQTITLYRRSGEFAGVRRFGSGNPIVIDGVQIWVEGVVGASGLELKADPGVPVVYAGFGGGPPGVWPGLLQALPATRSRAGRLL